MAKETIAEKIMRRATENGEPCSMSIDDLLMFQFAELHPEWITAGYLPKAWVQALAENQAG